MTILVTGATGFIGAALIRQLLNQGDKVRVLLRPQSNRRNLEGLQIEFAYGDLEDTASLESALKDCKRGRPLQPVGSKSHHFLQGKC
jgi:dihydroflavonol-4-reductase